MLFQTRVFKYLAANEQITIYEKGNMRHFNICIYVLPCYLICSSHSTTRYSEDKNTISSKLHIKSVDIPSEC